MENINRLESINDIENILYINLDSRQDRKHHVEKELIKIGIEKPQRFKAIKLENGALGCSMSHLKCVQHAKNNNWSHVLICEDDIEFLNPILFINQLNSFFKKHDNWDVILIAGNNMLPYEPVDNSCIKVSHCQTTTGYIVQNHYYDKLIENYKEGIQRFMREPLNKLYTIDKYWFDLQKKDNWFLIIPLSVIQREDYSDIEGKMTNFSNYMLNYNKCYK
jgi:glycosyl transferase family 25